MGDLPPSRGVRKLVLASSSPRRRVLLQRAGYVFEIHAPEILEDALPGEQPAALAERLACAKADAVARALAADCCALAADTIVVLDGRVFGKPRDVQHAAEMLCTLAGREHEVITGFCLQLGGAERAAVSGMSRSRVRMRQVTAAEAEAYAATEEPLDKAGSYAVQGQGGRFVQNIAGLRSNVIGLPVEEIAPLLAELGVEPQ